jgi:prefoldin beta subunit
MATLSKDAQEDIARFQQVQQQLQVLLMQKQNLQMQLSEIEGALKEVDKSKKEEVYEVIGNIMVKKNKKEVADSLKEKKEVIDLRISALDKQAEKLNERASELQSKLASRIKEEK